MLICYIECTSEEKYLTLGLWGKPVFVYPTQTAIESRCFDKIYVITKSRYIKYLVQELKIPVEVLDNRVGDGIIIDGRTALITSKMIRKIVDLQRNYNNYYLNDYITDEAQKVLVESALSFELALLLVRKKERKIWLREAVLKQIKEKQSILKSAGKQEICLLGHSQFEQWNVESLCGISVRNCGISGITLKEYWEDIVEKNLINLSSEKIIILLGTNDIALEKSMDEIFQDYSILIDGICKKTDSKIYLVESIHVSGRLDRENSRIDELNYRIRNRYSGKFSMIGTTEMDDAFGNLACKYTIDGLHLCDKGYTKLTEIVESSLR